MTQLVSVSTAGVQRTFKDHGHFNVEEVRNILTGLVGSWRSNEDVAGITRSIIFNELGIDELIAQTLWNMAHIELINVGNLVRQECNTGIFISWSVTPYAIMLEFSNADY